MKNRKGKWIADTPYDLLGWEIISVEMEGSSFTLVVEKKDTRERRTVHATIEAVPLHVLERFSGRM